MADKKPATYHCRPCGIKYELGEETILCLYFYQPWFNHIITTCPKCGQEDVVWNVVDDLIEHIRLYNQDPEDRVEIVPAEFADDEVIKEFCIDNDKPLIKERELTPRQQRQVDNQVGFFRYLLNRGETLGDAP